MSSIAAGSARGLARQANIVDVKVCDSAEPLVDKFILGLDFLATQAPGIVSISLEWRLSISNSYIVSIQNKIANLKSLGFVIVAAAGNGVAGVGVPVNDGSFVVVPAAAPDAMTVAAVQYGASDQRWPSSNYGPEVDIFAAATLDAVQPNGTPISDTGTSGSTALVAGAVAAAASYAGTSAGAALENFVEAGAIWNTVVNGNSPNAARLFSDLGTVAQATLPASQPPYNLFCGFGVFASLTTTSIAAAPNGDLFLTLEIRCPTTNTPVVFVVEKRNAAGMALFHSFILDPNGTNSGAGESIRSVAVNNTGSRIAFAVTTREPSRFPGTLLLGTPGGLDAYVVQMDASTGAIVGVQGMGTPSTDTARAIAYGSQSVYLGVVTEGSFAGQALVGASDLAVVTIDAATSAVQAATSYPRAGEVRINAGTMYQGSPVFVGATNADPLQNPVASFQAVAFHITGVTPGMFWLPQSGGDSEAYSASEPALTMQGNLFIASTRRIFPQPIRWHFVQINRINNAVSQWQTTWTASSGSTPTLITTPEADVYVRTGTSLLKASRDTVHFHENQPIDANGLALSSDRLISVGSTGLAARLGR